jgi:hypothetical protein
MPWKTYPEDVSGADLPLVNEGEYAVAARIRSCSSPSVTE